MAARRRRGSEINTLTHHQWLAGRTDQLGVEHRSESIDIEVDLLPWHVVMRSLDERAVEDDTRGGRKEGGMVSSSSTRPTSSFVQLGPMRLTVPVGQQQV